MSIVLQPNPVEKSACVITCTFYDEQGKPVTPKTLKWTLSDRNGNEVNGRKNVNIASPGNPESILLSGNDLVVTGRDTSRVFSVKATYDSSLGSDLPLNGEATFSVDRLVNVT